MKILQENQEKLIEGRLMKLKKIQKKIKKY